MRMGRWERSPKTPGGSPTRHVRTIGMRYELRSHYEFTDPLVNFKRAITGRLELRRDTNGRRHPVRETRKLLELDLKNTSVPARALHLHLTRGKRGQGKTVPVAPDSASLLCHPCAKRRGPALSIFKPGPASYYSTKTWLRWENDLRTRPPQLHDEQRLAGAVSAGTSPTSRRYRHGQLPKVPWCITICRQRACEGGEDSDS